MTNGLISSVFLLQDFLCFKCKQHKRLYVHLPISPIIQLWIKSDWITLLTLLLPGNCNWTELTVQTAITNNQLMETRFVTKPFTGYYIDIDIHLAQLEYWSLMTNFDLNTKTIEQATLQYLYNAIYEQIRASTNLDSLCVQLNLHGLVLFKICSVKKSAFSTHTFWRCKENQ